MPMPSAARACPGGCAGCGAFTDDGRNGVGPNLYDIIGKLHAQV
jgi:cytochrome c2